jgi:hypothetical protein
VSDELRQPLYGTGEVTMPLAAVTIALGSPVPGQASHGGRMAYGTFETWICLGCGYTEFYAQGLEGIEGVARRHPDRLRIVDAQPQAQGPYR